APLSARTSPRMIFMRVDLPAPLAPMRALVAPSPTRKLTSSSSGRPSGSVSVTPLTSMYPMSFLAVVSIHRLRRHSTSGWRADQNTPAALPLPRPARTPSLLHQGAARQCDGAVRFWGASFGVLGWPLGRPGAPMFELRKKLTAELAGPRGHPKTQCR